MRPGPLVLLLALAPLFLRGQPPAQAFKLPTGLTCLLVENHERPLLRMELTVRWDQTPEPPVKTGQLGFLASLMETAGAGTYSRAAFNRAADDLGLVRDFQARRNAFHWSMVSDSRSLEPAMELLANGVFRVDFDGPAMEAQRQLLLKQAAATGLREGAITRFLWDLGDGRAILPPAGAGLDRLELGALLALQRRLLVPERATLVLYGDLNLAQAKELVSLHFGVWGPLPATTPAAAVPPEAAARPFTALLESDAQAELWIGSARAGAVAMGLEELLGILLERRSRLAGPNLDLELALQPGGPLLFKARARATAKGSLVPVVMALLEGFRSQGFTAEDLNRAKLQWQARRAALSLHPQALLHAMLGNGMDAGLEAAVAGLTAAQVNQALAGWLEPAQLRYLLLGGDAALLKAAESAGLGQAALVRPQ